MESSDFIMRAIRRYWPTVRNASLWLSIPLFGYLSFTATRLALIIGWLSWTALVIAWTSGYLKVRP